MSIFKRFTLSEIEEMEVIHESQTDDLVLEQGQGDGQVRVWVSRMTVSDGMPYNNQVTVEKLTNGAWETIDEYEPI